MAQDITWYPVTQFSKVPKRGLSLTYSGSGKITFSRALGDELEDRRINFGEVDGKLCFAFAVATIHEVAQNGPPGLLVRRRQVSDAVLKRHCKGLKAGTRVHFDFDPDQAIFIESRRDHLSGGSGSDDTIEATRQPIAELQL